MSPSTSLDHTLLTVKRAAQALSANPMRTGALLHLPAFGEVLIAGDLHGDVSSFDRIIELADLDGSPRRHLVLQELIHGNDDPPERFGSCLLIEKASALVARFPRRVHVLMGNHEMAELSARVVIKDGRALNEVFGRSLEARYDGRHEEALAYFKGFWRAMPLAISTPNRLFISHSTPSLQRTERCTLEVLKSGDVLEDLSREGAAYALLWGRDFSEPAASRLSREFDSDFFIVGHTPCPDGFRIPSSRHVILDSQGPTGCYVLLPLDRALTLDEIAGRIRPLWANRRTGEQI